MVFSSVTFLFIFLPLSIVIYYLCPCLKSKNLFLLFISLLFYFWGAKELLWVIIFSACLDYSLGILQWKSKKSVFKKISLLLSLTINLGLLCYFKYTYFILDNLGASKNLLEQAKTIALPLGISFYTFQTLSYQIDLYLNKTKVQKSFLDFILYVSLFPQLIAGPIVRYKDLSDQLTDRKHNIDKFCTGILRFVEGLIKKIIIADTLGMFVDTVFIQDPNSLNAFIALMGSIVFVFQLFFDFSGYSDMAIGISLIFGFKLKENFLHPLYARSITAFWQGWHISLTTWLRDYIYIPLCSLSNNKFYRALALIFVFTICGLWHGANWTFIIFGFYFGVILILEKFFWKSYGRKMPFLMQHLYVWVILIIASVVFRSQNINYCFEYLKAFTHFNFKEHYNSEVFYSFNSEVKFSLLLAFFFSMPLERIIENFKITNFNLNPIVYNFKYLILITGFLYALILSGARTYNPFVYFQF